MKMKNRNNKIMIISILLVIFILSSFAIFSIGNTNGKNATPKIEPSNKYDLDYTVDIPESNVHYVNPNDKDNGIEIQGLHFNKGTYRILYEMKGIKNILKIMFVNPDSSDGDYIIPVKRGDYSKDDQDYIHFRNRTYKLKSQVEVYGEEDTNRDYVLLHLLQPPPSKGLFNIKLDFKLSIAEIMAMMQGILILLAVAFYFFETHRETAIAQREMYQNLEFKSIEIFQFEIKEIEQIWPLFDDNEMAPAPKTKEWWIIASHICSIMNLFEMIIEFRSDNKIDSKIFLTWVAWFWTISSKDNFAKLWVDLQTNYTPELKMIMKKGIEIKKQLIKDNKDVEEGERILLDYIKIELDIEDKIYDEFIKNGERNQYQGE